VLMKIKTDVCALSCSYLVITKHSHLRIFKIVSDYVW
jgi:hypothetical protein